MKTLAFGLLCAAIGAIVATQQMDWRNGTVSAQEASGPRSPVKQNSITTPPPPALYDRDGLSPEEVISVYVYDRNNRSVANITTKIRSEGFFLFDEPSEGSGSGSVLDQSGHVLTNYHVIEGAQEVKVTLYNGVSYDAVLVGADPINDIAVIRIEAPDDVLSPVAIGDSSELRVGMRIYTIGNPFGLERTMTSGIISSLNRTLQVSSSRTIKSIIQVDAAINPGNSGGPLLDSHGRLIGMNTAIASRTGQSAGVGFAIPINLITRVVRQLIRYGRVIRPETGILSVYETEDGLLITQLAEKGPAEQAGLRGPKITRHRRGPLSYLRIDRSAADLIVAVDGEAVETADDLLTYVESKRPGDQVVVKVIRAGQYANISLILGGDRTTE